MSSLTWSENQLASVVGSLINIEQNFKTQDTIVPMKMRTVLTTVSDLKTVGEGAQYRIDQIGRYALNWPLWVRVKPVDDIYVAIEDEFDLWSDGVTEQDAIEGVKSFFLQVLRRYKETPDDRLELLARQEKRQYIAITNPH